MLWRVSALAPAGCLTFAAVPGAAVAQQWGGVLKFFHRDSPASMSIHEEATISTVAPVMSVFNNLVLFNQHEKQNRTEFIESELAESWSSVPHQQISCEPDCNCNRKPWSSADEERYRDHAGRRLEGPDPPFSIHQCDQGHRANYQYGVVRRDVDRVAHEATSPIYARTNYTS
jgi:hypothetical protein